MAMGFVAEAGVEIMRNSIKKVSSAATVPCKYRGTGIECPNSDFRRGLCESCGWNPLVEAERIAEIMEKEKRHGNS